MKRRLLVLLVASLLLATVLGQLNHYLGLLQIHVWCGGLFVTYAALRLDFRTGAWSVFLAGLLLDASAPVAFGTQALLFLAAHAVVYYVRGRAPAGNLIVGVITALLANLGLFIALSFICLGDAPDPGEAWMRNFADLLASQLVLTLIAPWFFAAQARCLELGGADLRTASRSAA